MSVSSEVNDAKPQNKRSETVNAEIFKQLKLSYTEHFHKSPSKLREKLDQVFPDDFKRANDGSGSLLSDKLVREFFKVNTPPTASTKTLNYLCKVMLDYASYGDAIRSLETKDEEVPPKPVLAEAFDMPDKIDLTDAWLEPYRVNVKGRWQEIKVLDMEEALLLEDIYVGTYFLKSIKGRRKLEYEDLVVESFDKADVSGRSKLDDDLEESVDGLEKLKEKSKLIILGSGGAGKTAFLKHLVLRYLDPQIALDDFDVSLISVYIPLKIWAKEIVESNIVEVIAQIFRQDIPDLSIEVIEKILKAGQFLILFDALDESGQQVEAVGKAIREFTKKYINNRMVLTSRLQTTERQFDDFTEVEIADFTEAQVEDFANKWFTVRSKVELGKKFLMQLKDTPTIYKLSSRPLSLTYLCLVFRENLGFPKNKSDIYENVVDIFIRRWDVSRDIDDRTPVADKLSAKRKRLLFGQIAYQGMIKEPPQFIWKERDLKSQIREFIEKLPTVKEDEIDVDTDLVLKVVIRDHGLLVPMSKSLYGFPYRTFQEYFAAKDIEQYSNNYSFLKEIIRRYLTCQEWKNVFLMVAELTRDADEMFKLIFDYVNNLVAENETLQKMLTWLHKITRNFGVDSSSWRALMIAIDLDTDLYISHEVQIEKLSAQQTPVVMKSFNAERKKIISNNSKLISSLYLIVAHTFAIDKANGEAPTLKNSSEYMKTLLVVDEDTTTEQQIALAINEAKEIGDIDPNFLDNLISLQKKLPSEADTKEIWLSWSERLRKLLLTHLDIGHRVKFSKEDEKVLENYLFANNLLVKCLAGDGLCNRNLRDRIFDHILLPTDSIPDDLKLNSYS
jgi:predicted NACHT family NTPase